MAEPSGGFGGTAVLGCCVGGVMLPAALLFFLVFVVVIVLGVKNSGDYERALKALAAEGGLEVRRFSRIEPSRAEGECRGRKVLVDVMMVHTESGDMDNEKGFDMPYTRAQASLKRAANYQLLVKREGVQTKLDKAFKHAKDIEIGLNKEFDRKFMATATSEGKVRELLDSEIQGRMLEINLHLREVLVEGESVRCLMIGKMGDKVKLKKLLDLACDLAEKAEKSMTG